MFLKEATLLFLIGCIYLVHSSNPDSEVESFAEFEKELHKQLQSNLDTIKNETEALRKFLEDTKKTLATNPDSKTRIRQLMEIRQNITNLMERVTKLNKLNDNIKA